MLLIRFHTTRYLIVAVSLLPPGGASVIVAWPTSLAMSPTTIKLVGGKLAARHAVLPDHQTPRAA